MITNKNIKKTYILHNDKKIGTKHFGVPKNPFEASKSNSKLVSKNIDRYLK